MAESRWPTHELPVGDSVSRLTVVEQGADIGAVLAGWLGERDLFVVASRPVWRLHGDAVLSGLEKETSRWTLLEVPDGESAKTPAVAESLWREMASAGARRDCRLLTLGGGSVCDLGAFVAATYMRGVAFSHLPTTLLAQVDAAIGGKSALNLGGIKNLVGVFRQPEHVVAAVEFLATLPGRQLRSGLVEAIKVAALCDGELFERIEDDLDPLLADPRCAAWRDLIAAAQRAKAEVVAADPHEAGERRVLNFGHTLGHALESVLDYEGLTHGEAVAHGMRFAVQLAVGRGLDGDVARRFEALLDRLELTETLQLTGLEVGPLVAAMRQDKKARAEGIVWVLPTGLGSWEAVVLEAELVAEELGRFLASSRDAC